MTPKSVIILAAVTAAAVAGAAAALNSERGFTQQTASGPVFPGLIDKVNEVAKIAVDHKDGRYSIVRGADGVWSVPESDGYTANQGQAKKIILQMADLKLFEAKTAKPDLYNRLHLEDMKKKDTQARRVRLYDAKDGAVAEVVVGKKRYNLPGTLREGAYIRKPGDPQTWLARGEIDVPTDVKSWLRNGILNIREEDVATIDIRHPDGEVIKITKEDPKAKHFTLHGVPEGKKLKYDSDPGNIASVVEDLELDDARKEGHVAFDDNNTLSAVYTSRSGLIAKLWLTKVNDAEWLKLEVSAKPDAPAPKEGAKSAAEIAKRVTEWTRGWVYRIPDFKAQRLRRNMAEMAGDKKAGS